MLATSCVSVQIPLNHTFMKGMNFELKVLKNLPDCGKSTTIGSMTSYEESSGLLVVTSVVIIVGEEVVVGFVFVVVVVVSTVVTDGTTDGSI